MDTPEQLDPTPTAQASAFIQVIGTKGIVQLACPLPLIKHIFQRAFNTMTDIPPELYQFSDQLEKL